MKKTILVIIACLVITTIFASCASKYEDGSYYLTNNEYYHLTNYNKTIGIDSSASYTPIIENQYVETAESNEVFVSLDTNTASYAHLRGLINNSKTTSVPQDAVKVEEMLNYFSYDYTKPAEDEDFALNYSIFDCPYNSNAKLLRIGLQAAQVEMGETVNNIVMLIDVSGSMYGSDRLGLIQESFKLITENIKPQDRVSIVTYASGVSLALDGAYGYEANKIRAVIEDLEASGSTNGEGGIELAYQVAEKYYVEGGNNRIILATDGDFNVGVSGPDGVTELIKQKSQSGVFLSVLGVGYSNYQQDTMEALALNGNGNMAFLDSLIEAKKVLVNEFGGTFRVLAKDAKAKVEFNSELVKSYRLIGYENKQLSEDDFNDTKKDAGEIGSGHSVTIVFEIVLNDPVEIDEQTNLAQIVLRYKSVDDQDKEFSEEIKAVETQMTQIDKFISAVIEFALVLRNSDYKGSASLININELLDFVKDSDNDYYKDFYALVATYAERLDESVE